MSNAESAALDWNEGPEVEQEELFSEEERLGGALKPYAPQKFSQRHRLVCSLHATGMTNREIAEALRYDESRVSVILNDPRAERYIQEAARAVESSITDVQMRLKLLAHEAVDELEHELRAVPDVKVRQRAAFGVLDRAGYGKMETQVRVSGELPDKAVKELSDALGENEVIEAEYEFEEPDEHEFDTRGDNAGRDAT